MSADKPLQLSPHLAEYVRLLLDLHRLFIQGKEDTQEADDLRDEMEVPASYLSREEVTFAQGVSGDLYQLQDDEICGRFDAPDQIQEWEARLRDASGQDDWLAVLELERTRPSSRPARDVLLSRALAYEKLGFPDIASAFAEYARRAACGSIPAVQDQPHSLVHTRASGGFGAG